MPKTTKDITGKKIGLLTVLRQDQDLTWSNGRVKRMWLCRCDCGNIKSISGQALTSGTVSCGCYRKEIMSAPRPHMIGKGNFHDLTGERFGRLLVLGRDKNKGIDVTWLCQCDCGNKAVVVSHYLVSGNTKSCGCLQIDTRKANNLKKRKEFGESMFNHLVSEYKTSAKKRGLTFSLSSEEFRTITKRPCYYCGQSPSSVRKDPAAYGEFIYNGIDRIDNSKGYSLENCVSCCFICNRAKGNLSKSLFLEWVRKISKNLFA